VARLRWTGSLEAQKEADEAYAKLKMRRKKSRRNNARKAVKASQRREKQTEQRTKNRPNYFHYMNSPEWAAKRRDFFKLAGYRCEDCGEKGNLSVHHLHYRTLGRERRQDVKVLCWPCHCTYHQDKRLDAELDQRVATSDDASCGPC
jgi:5-methylcytosine-specific restriction endonuclease McrA